VGRVIFIERRKNILKNFQGKNFSKKIKKIFIALPDTAEDSSSHS